MLPKLG